MRIVRVYFNKKDEAVYVSHLDLQRVIMRSLRRASIPAWYTLGFNPHIYLTFALPLSLGHESLCESFDFKIESETIEKELWIKNLNEALPKGITVTDIGFAQDEACDITLAKYKIDFKTSYDVMKTAIDGYNALSEAVVTKKGKKGKTKEVDIKTHINNVEIEKEGDSSVAMLDFPAGGSFNLNPDLFINFLADTYNIDLLGAKVCRLEVLTKDMKKFK